MYCSKKEFILLDIIIGPEKERYKTVVQMIVDTIEDVLENYGPFPYIELVHELIEQFDDIKHDLVNKHHQNIKNLYEGSWPTKFYHQKIPYLHNIPSKAMGLGNTKEFFDKIAKNGRETQLR